MTFTTDLAGYALKPYDIQISKKHIDIPSRSGKVMGNKGERMNKGDFVDICKGRIRFDAIGLQGTEMWIAPLSTFSMRMIIIDDEKGDYKHYFIDNGREIEVDGATFMEAQDKLFCK